MSSGGSPDPQGAPADSSTDDKTELFLAIVALVISVAALIISLLQALQQYYSSATGYSSCTRAIMGQWAQFTSRRLRWGQFRLEVQFEVPVIFVAPPTNTKGPLGSTDEKTIVYMDGSPESYQESCTWSQDEFDHVQKAFKGGDTQQSIHTADNELASWNAVLMAVQRMEKESREWQDAEFFHYKPPEKGKACHTLTVALQKKRRSWDSMPDSLKKPYATTTISHMVEITAMLGIFWKEFNRNNDIYRAQGNGFIIEGSNVDDLGVAFRFLKVGPTWFQENRVVPNDRVKELCFGFCPTIFRPHGDKSHQYTDEPADKGTLQLGSQAEIAETLLVLGCNTNTVNYFRQDDGRARHTHLFPVPFEILGMIGVVLQIESTAFCMLPNPTVYYWNKTSFSLRRLMAVYSAALELGQPLDKLLKPNPRLKAIREAAARIESRFLSQHDGNGLAPPKKPVTERPHLPEIIAVLHAAIRECDQYLIDPVTLPLTLHVVRVHLQEVLKMLNRGRAGGQADKDCDAAGTAEADTASAAAAPPSVRSVDGTDANEGPPTLAELDAASSAARHGLFVDMYVSWVRRRVVRTVCAEVAAERAHARRGTVSTATEAAAAALLLAEGDEAAAEGDEDASGTPTSREQRVNDIWCTLVFRMLCWLLLHDFHKKDIQISKSGVFGSRLPVYIM